MKHSIKNKRNAFTLIEIMIALLIIGIISSVLIPNYSNIQTQSKENAVKSVCHTLQVALEAYNLSTGTYPTSGSLSITELSTTLQTTKSLSQTPKNPFTGQTYTTTDSAGKITYTYDTTTQSYTLHGFGQNNETEIVTLKNM